MFRRAFIQRRTLFDNPIIAAASGIVKSKNMEEAIDGLSKLNDKATDTAVTKAVEILAKTERELGNRWISDTKINVSINTGVVNIVLTKSI